MLECELCLCEGSQPARSLAPRHDTDCGRDSDRTSPGFPPTRSPENHQPTCFLQSMVWAVGTHLGTGTQGQELTLISHLLWERPCL